MRACAGASGVAVCCFVPKRAKKQFSFWEDPYAFIHSDTLNEEPDVGQDRLCVRFISVSVYSKEQPIAKATLSLCGPSSDPLKVRSQFGVMDHNGGTTTLTVYVVQKLVTPLLGFPAITDLLMLMHLVDSVNRELQADIKKQ